MPEAGVPDNTPADVSVTPDGSVPDMSEKLIFEGVPVAVKLNDPFVPTLKLVLAALENVGATGVGVGVTITVPEAVLLPTVLVALTEQVYCVPLASPITDIGDTELLPVPLGVQLAV